MGKRQRDQLQAGRIIKQIAPVLDMTVEELTHFFYTETFWKENSARHYLMGDTPWPFENMGYDDCHEMVCAFLDEQQQEGKLTEQDMKEKQKEVERILHVAFLDLDTLSVHGKELPDTGTDKIEDEIEWIMRDISNLDIETLYVLNRYFDAFSSVTERDLKWIDLLDCLGYVDGLVTMDEFIRQLLKEEFPVSCGLISENMSRKDFLQWLELLSRRGYKDTTRKTDSNRLKSAIEKRVRSYTDECGFEIISLHNFIQYLVNEHNGSFFDVEPKYWKVFVLIKYWVSHFEDVPEIAINIYPPQIEEEQQP